VRGLALRRHSSLSASLAIPGLCLVAGLAAACSFDANRLRPLPASTSDGPASPDAVVMDGQVDYASVLDVPAGRADVLRASATDSVGENDGPTEIGGTKHDSGPVATGGAGSSDLPVATGGNGAGGTVGAGGAANSVSGADAAAGSGGAGTGGASGLATGGGGDESGSVASGGATDTGGSGGAIGGGRAGGAASGGSSSGGQTGGGHIDAAADVAGAGHAGDSGVDAAADVAHLGSGGVDAPADTAGTGGTGGSGVDAPANAAATDGTGDSGVDAASDASGIGGCSGQCPLIATIGITGPWGYTFTNGTYGDVITTGDSLFSAWLASVASNCAVQDLDISNSNYLTAERLAPYQVILVLDLYHTQADKDALIRAKKTTAYPSYLGTQRALLASEVTAVTNWVNNGGGLMTTIGIVGTAAEMANANLLLNPFGIAYSVTNMQIMTGNSTVSDLLVTPPIANQINAGVSQLPVNAGVSIEGLAGQKLPSSSSTFSIYAGSGTTASGGGGYAVGIAKITGAGRVNVWGDECIEYDSAWSNSTDQVRTYWNNVLSWLGPCP